MKPADLETISAETGVDIKTVQRVLAALPVYVRSEQPEMVTLRHPKLPAGQVIQVDRRRIGARLASGWVEAAPEPPAGPEPTEPAAEPETEPTESAPKRRSRKSTEEQ